MRVGDVCYALIGQIINRSLLAVRYQPSAILVVNSPLEAPDLIADIKRDWADIDANGLTASLLADARSTGDLMAYFRWATEALAAYPQSPQDVPASLVLARWSWDGPV